jgi:Protein of unknown function (DUF4232)
MRLATGPGRWLGVGRALACVAIVLSSAVLAESADSTTSAPSAAASPMARCRAAGTEVWAAVEAAGTAGTVYYELEFSNVGRRTCTLHGFPSVWAVNAYGVKVGVRASNRGAPSTVVLRPGSTAHAVLGVTTTGAVCGTLGVAAAGLRVVPPGQTLPKTPGERDWVEHFPLQVCANQSSMHVLPVHAGTGIPNYSFS